jgi:hypothetical protein
MAHGKNVSAGAFGEGSTNLMQDWPRDSAVADLS